MPRLSTASVRLVMKRNRRMSDGTYPIYVVVSFGGRVERKTGVSCLERNWDARREVIKRSQPNAPVLNRMLQDVKSAILERKNALEFAGRRYTPLMLIEGVTEDFSGSDSVYWTLCRKLIDERRLRDGTVRSYTYSYRKLSEYLHRNEFIVDEITLGVVKDFAYWMERGGIRINTIKRVLSCIASVWNYAIAHNLAEASAYPFKQFKYTSRYKDVHRDYFLEEEHITRLRDYWMNLVSVSCGDRWTYREGALDRLSQRWSEEWGILWFLLCYRLNGSSPIDVALLEPGSCRRVNIGGEEYWSVEIRRKKTGRDVHMRLRRDRFIIMGLEHFLGISGKFVYPVLYWREDADDRYYLEQSHKASQKAMKWVRRAYLTINEDIARDNAEKGLNVPLVDVGRLVMYSARHSRASHFFNHPGTTIGGLASMLARSANTISTYAHTLVKDEDYAGIDDESVI